MDIMSMETHGAPARLLYRSFRAFLKTRCGDYAVGYERPLSGGATAAPEAGTARLLRHRRLGWPVGAPACGRQAALGEG